MRIVSIILTTGLAGGCAAPSHPPNLESMVSGSWCAGDASTSYEELELTVEDGEHIFRSWLHERPESTGSWSMRGRVLSIGGGPTYTVLQASPDKMILGYPGGQPETYVRHNCFKVQVPQASR